MSVRSLTIKGIPETLYHRLKRCATEHRRSLNREVIASLERAVQGQRVDPEELLAQTDALRAHLALPPVTVQLLRKAKEGRP